MEHFLANIKDIGIFLAVLSVLIVVHEWGHFIVARRLGVRVEKFSVGFGPKIFSRRHKGTEFMVCLIPLGGFVKMAGDDRTECKGAPEEFYSKPPGHRALIVLNGPVINYALALIFLIIVFMLGYPDLSAKIGKLEEGYPAQTAGLKVGDQIVGIDSREVDNWTDLQKLIAGSRAGSLRIEILREGEKVMTVISPRIERRKNVFGQEIEQRLIGIQPVEEIITLKYPPGTAVVKGTQKLLEITWLTYKSIYFMLTGSMSAKESVTGPIGIFYIVKSAFALGFSHLLFIVGVISASLAIFNLLPIIPLDGGHLFLFGIEKLRGRALPQKIDEYIARAGFAAIILLAVFVFYSDFARFGWIEKIRNFFS